MGLPKASKLKDAAKLKRKKIGGSYIVDAETGGQILRPDWTKSFTDNSAWHTRIVEFMRQKIPLDNPMITTAIMYAKADEDVLDRVEVAFKNMSTEARKLLVSANSEIISVEKHRPTAIFNCNSSAQMAHAIHVRLGTGRHFVP